MNERFLCVLFALHFQIRWYDFASSSRFAGGKSYSCASCAHIDARVLVFALPALLLRHLMAYLATARCSLCHCVSICEYIRLRCSTESLALSRLLLSRTLFMYLSVSVSISLCSAGEVDYIFVRRVRVCHTTRQTVSVLMSLVSSDKPKHTCQWTMRQYRETDVCVCHPPYLFSRILMCLPFVVLYVHGVSTRSTRAYDFTPELLNFTVKIIISADCHSCNRKVI